MFREEHTAHRYSKTSHSNCTQMLTRWYASSHRAKSANIRKWERSCPWFLPLYFHLNWMKQHSVQRCLSRRLRKETCWLFHNFSLGSGNEVLSCSDHGAKLSSSRAEDSPWRGTPRQQLAWHIRPLQQLHKDRSSLCGYMATCVWVIVCKQVHTQGNSHLGCFLFKFGPGHLWIKCLWSQAHIWPQQFRNTLESCSCNTSVVEVIGSTFSINTQTLMNSISGPMHASLHRCY